MADKAAGPERSGGEATDDATAGGDELQPKFREALERKRAREAGSAGVRGGKNAGKIHGVHGPARSRRPFRRKSG